jgi:hypothetical protein
MAEPDIATAMEAASEVLSIARAGTVLLAPSVRGDHDDLRAARRSFQIALRETVLYINRVRADRSAYSATEEQRLSALWAGASDAIADFDPNLAKRCYIKGQGWLDPAVWEHPRFRAYKVGIDDMREAGAELFDHGRPTQVPNWFPAAGLIFAFFTFISLTYFLVGPGIPAGRRVIFDVWVAFCVAASAAFLGGTAVATGHLSLPFAKRAPIQFSTIGGVAIFVVVLILMVSVNREISAPAGPEPAVAGQPGAGQSAAVGQNPAPALPPPQPNCVFNEQGDGVPVCEEHANTIKNIGAGTR